MRDHDMNAYPRIARRLLDKSKGKAKRFIRFEGIHIIHCSKSLHRTAIACRWRMFWRIKRYVRTHHP